MVELALVMKADRGELDTLNLEERLVREARKGDGDGGTSSCALSRATDALGDARGGRKPLEPSLLARNKDCTAEDSPTYVAPVLGSLTFGDSRREEALSTCTAPCVDRFLSADLW